MQNVYLLHMKVQKKNNEKISREPSILGKPDWVCKAFFKNVNWFDHARVQQFNIESPKDERVKIDR